MLGVLVSVVMNETPALSLCVMCIHVLVRPVCLWCTVVFQHAVFCNARKVQVQPGAHFMFSSVCVFCNGERTA